MTDLFQHEYQIYLKRKVAENTSDKYDEYGVDKNGHVLKGYDQNGH